MAERQNKKKNKELKHWQQEYLNLATLVNRSMKIEMIEGKYKVTFSEASAVEQWLNGIDKKEN